MHALHSEFQGVLNHVLLVYSLSIGHCVMNLHQNWSILNTHNVFSLG